jgi:hypothetical protein
MMADITPTTWFPVLTLVAGYIMKAVSDRLDHSRAVQRERENRRETHRIQLAERRAEFQRKTLLDLQEAIQDLLRASGSIIHSDTMTFRTTGEWRRQKLPEGLSQDQFVANRKCILLIVRVRNDEIRNLAHSFRIAALDASNSPDEKTANSKMLGAGDNSERLHKLIGEQLRQLDDEEESMQ